MRTFNSVTNRREKMAIHSGKCDKCGKRLDTNKKERFILTDYAFLVTDKHLVTTRGFCTEKTMEFCGFDCIIEFMIDSFTVAEKEVVNVQQETN